MKTLKELYEIVKAAGGDFPFAVEWEGDQEHFRGGGPYLAFSETPSKNNIAIEDQDSLEIYSWSDFTSMWQFPKDSLYINHADNGPSYTEWLKENHIKYNRQRWEDMGRPWGRLREHAELLNHKDADRELKYELLSVKNEGAYCKIGDTTWGIPFKYLRLSDKTLLNLDDWLEPGGFEFVGPDIELPTKPTWAEKPVCEFCKGKEELTWNTTLTTIPEMYPDQEDKKSYQSITMPCPYCQPKRFTCAD